MPRSRPDDLHGILPVDKPAGWTSHDVVARLRRLTSMRRIGHAGTLDPFATGVLVIGVGRATRLLRYIQESEKRYLAHLVLGVQTDTFDVEGQIVNRIERAVWPSHEAMVEVVRQFAGTIKQVPPAFSAVRVAGRRLYELARAGEAVEAPAREVTISSIEVEHYSPPDVLIDVTCSSGTYIRSLVRDIGLALGTGAYCHGLRRTRVGSFTLDRCWTIDDLAAPGLRARWSLVAEGPDAGLEDWPAIVLRGEDEQPWYDGRLIRDLPGARSNDVRVRVYTASGVFAGLGRLSTGGQLRPEIVFKID